MSRGDIAILQKTCMAQRVLVTCPRSSHLYAARSRFSPVTAESTPLTSFLFHSLCTCVGCDLVCVIPIYCGWRNTYVFWVFVFPLVMLYEWLLLGRMAFLIWQLSQQGPWTLSSSFWFSAPFSATSHYATFLPSFLSLSHTCKTPFLYISLLRNLRTLFSCLVEHTCFGFPYFLLLSLCSL